MVYDHRIIRPRSDVPKPIPAAGLALWVDASDEAAVTLVSDTYVSSVWDKSGAARSVGQTTANNRPTYGTVSGRKAFTFDGTNDSLLVTPNVVMAGGATLFMVLQRTLEDNVAGIHSFQGDYFSSHHPYGVDTYYDSFASTVRHTWSQAYISVPYIYSIVADSTWSAYINNSLGLSEANTLSNQASGVPQLLGSGAHDFKAAMHLHEAIVYERAISASERNAIHSYLTAKWSIT